MYTTQGLMTAADLADRREDIDGGTTMIYIDDLDPSRDVLTAVDGVCDVCGNALTSAFHGSITRQDIDGSIVECTTADGETNEPSDFPEDYHYSEYYA